MIHDELSFKYFEFEMMIIYQGVCKSSFGQKKKKVDSGIVSLGIIIVSIFI